MTSGNTDTIAAAFGGELTWARDPWSMRLAADFIYSSDHGDTTAERYHAVLHGERKLGGGRTYVFGQVTYDRDQPAGLDYRYIPTLGIGRTFVDNGCDELKGEVGAGMTFEKRTGLAETSDPSGYVGVRYAHKWSDKRAFRVNAEFFPNFNDFDLSVGRLAFLYEMPLAGKFSITAGLRFDYVVKPPPGTEDLDIFFLIGFSASF
jgi:putative salt-induced outer membrane protein YdiY